MTNSSMDLRGRVAVVTGGYGVLGGTIASGLAAAGARVAILGRNRSAADAKAREIQASGADTTVLIADALDEAAVRAARDELLQQWGRVDILINAAGGHVAGARNDDRSIFDGPPGAFDAGLRLNFHATVIPSTAFGAATPAARSGTLAHISSVACGPPLGRGMGS